MHCTVRTPDIIPDMDCVEHLNYVEESLVYTIIFKLRKNFENMGYGTSFVHRYIHR